jgi:hypothetical protein
MADPVGAQRLDDLADLRDAVLDALLAVYGVVEAASEQMT